MIKEKEMTKETQLVLKQALSNIEEVKSLVKDKTYEEALKLFDIATDYEELFDFSYGAISGTVFNEKQKPVLQKHFEVWDDKNAMLLMENKTCEEINAELDKVKAHLKNKKLNPSALETIKAKGTSSDKTKDEKPQTKDIER